MPDTAALEPLDDTAQVGSPSGDATPSGGAESTVLELIQKLCKDKALPHKVKRKMVMQALKMLPDFAPEAGEPEEPEMEAVGGDVNVNSGGDITPRKKTERSETSYPADEGPGSGGVAKGRVETMEAKKRMRRIKEEVDTHLQQLRDTQDPANVLLAESLGQQFEKELKEEQELYDKLDRYQAAEALNKKRQLGMSLCKKAKLQEQLITEAFQTQLINAQDEKEMVDLIEDRKYIASIQRPVARRGYIGYIDTDKPPTENKAANVSDNDVARALRRSRTN